MIQILIGRLFNFLEGDEIPGIEYEWPLLQELMGGITLADVGAAIDRLVHDDNTVIEYTRKHLANCKVPRSVVFIDELPRNAGGKVVKPTLRKMT